MLVWWVRKYCCWERHLDNTLLCIMKDQRASLNFIAGSWCAQTSSAHYVNALLILYYEKWVWSSRWIGSRRIGSWRIEWTPILASSSIYLVHVAYHRDDHDFWTVTFGLNLHNFWSYPKLLQNLLFRGAVHVWKDSWAPILDLQPSTFAVVQTEDHPRMPFSTLLHRLGHCSLPKLEKLSRKALSMLCRILLKSHWVPAFIFEISCSEMHAISRVETA